MTTNLEQRITEMWERQKAAQKSLQDVADEMGNIAIATATNKITLSENGWDGLRAKYDKALSDVRAIGLALEKLTGTKRCWSSRRFGREPLLTFYSSSGLS